MKREVELGTQQGEGGPQLVPGLGDEVALAVQSKLEAGEHLVERRAQPLELVAGRGHRQARAGAVGRDLLRPASHRLHRA